MDSYEYKTLLWSPAAKLDRRKMRSYEKAISYIHKLAMELGARSVSDIAISSNTKKYLSKLLDKHIRKEYSYLPKDRRRTSASMEKLSAFPATLVSANDYTIYTIMEK